MATVYYRTLLASLPALPRLDRVERLPMGEAALLGRLRLLSDADREQLEAVLDLLRWREIPIERQDDVHVARYRELLERLGDRPLLQRYLEARMSRRSVLAGLRHRAIAPDSPPQQKPWGTGESPRWIEAHWREPEFRLAASYPWLSQARSYLAEGRALHLERLLLEMEWQHTSRFSDEAEPFSFERVCTYVLQWDILARRLSYEKGDTRQRFRDLVDELSAGHA